MNGPHDMGGMQCYGAVEREENEPLFHADWEARALAITVASGFCGQWNIDISRHARETLPPEFYLTKSYYQIWIAGLEKLLQQYGMAMPDEIATGQVQTAGLNTAKRMNAENMPAALAKGAPVDRKIDGSPQFMQGETVHTRNLNPSGHCRLPRYARDKTGVILTVQGAHVFPDTNANEKGESPQWLYSVGFQSTELFGEAADERDMVMVDCWEPYLEKFR
ncbi:MAG: nitrile hydratase subunit beta [Pseudomonadota bacterium]